MRGGAAVRRGHHRYGGGRTAVLGQRARSRNVAAAAASLIPVADAVRRSTQADALVLIVFGWATKAKAAAADHCGLPGENEYVKYGQPRRAQSIAVARHRNVVDVTLSKNFYVSQADTEGGLAGAGSSEPSNLKHETRRRPRTRTLS